jgi:GT2 family glycosyltransferase
VSQALTPHVTVVVATIDRLEAVELCLDRLTLLLDVAIEIIVVVGPGGDHVAARLSQRPDIAALLRNPERNLARSRNMALSLARGEFVAFIDDDAYPTEWWLEDLLGEFSDDEVLAVGGSVYDYTGYTYQMRYGRCTNAGDATPVNAPPVIGLSECPSAATFTYATGGNFVARTAQLRSLGGFDEQFDYYLEETDLCRRMLDAGGIVRVVDGGQIFHKFLPSAIRSAARVALDRRSILINRAYFAARHQLPDASPTQVLSDFKSFADKAVAELERALDEGVATIEHVSKIKHDVVDAGALLATWVITPPTMRPSTISPGADALTNTHAVSLRASKGVSHYAFISDYPIGEHSNTYSQAVALRDQGHVVRIIEPADGHATVDVEAGIWRHRIPLPRRRAVLSPLRSELERIANEQRALDSIYAPTSMAAELAEIEGVTFFDPTDAP